MQQSAASSDHEVDELQNDRVQEGGGVSLVTKWMRTVFVYLRGLFAFFGDSVDMAGECGAIECAL